MKTDRRRWEMKFFEAKEELKKLAGGEYHSICYELTEYSSGSLDMKCSMYVHGYQHTDGCDTWEEALANMAKQMGKADPIEATRRAIEQMPS
jgi:hypothetical protein